MIRGYGITLRTRVPGLSSTRHARLWLWSDDANTRVLAGHHHRRIDLRGWNRVIDRADWDHFRPTATQRMRYKAQSKLDKMRERARGRT